MTVSKGKKAILTAGLSVGVAVLLLSYAAYGWFTSSSTVTATGIAMSASAPNNIQISLVGDNDNKNWSETVNIDIKEVLKKQIQDFDNTADLFILPASSLAGFDDTFFATINANADGTASSSAVFTDGLSVHQAKDGYEGHYIDIPLYFRNQSDEGVTLALDKTANGANDKPTAITPVKQDNAISKIARVAFLSKDDKTKNSMGMADPLVLTGDGAISPKVLVGKDPTAFGNSKYIQFDNTTKLSDESIIEVYPATYGESVTTYPVSSMVVRIWIEGQDNACTVAVGNQVFTVDLKFSVK